MFYLPPIERDHIPVGEDRRITVSAASVGVVDPLAGANRKPSTETTLLFVTDEKLSGLKPWKTVCDVVSTLIGDVHCLPSVKLDVLALTALTGPLNWLGSSSTLLVVNANVGGGPHCPLLLELVVLPSDPETTFTSTVCPTYRLDGLVNVSPEGTVNPFALIE
jgi:hypothetical protein